MSYRGNVGSPYDYTTTNMTDTSQWLNRGDNGWQLTSATLVGLQSMAGLTILYAGIMRSKWAINSAFMAIYAFSATLIVWVLWAYKMSFGEYWLPFLGKPGPVLSMDQELVQSQLPSMSPVALAKFPLSTMIYFQFVFAAITVIIMAGSFLGRMSFTAWAIFVPLWITFSYTVSAYAIWGGGFLFQMGVIDYSGGYVIHVSSGTAGFVGAHFIGPRLTADREDSRPHNMIGVIAGAGILWMGWNGFNGGDPFNADVDAGAAVLNTNICTATSLLCWVLCDVVYYKKPSIIGAVQGMICGLVAITPCAGVIAGWASIVVGIASGTLPWLSMNLMGKKVAYFRHIDDTLGVFHTHLVAGFVGGFSAGLFATEEGCAAFACINPGGAIAGNGSQVWLQIVGALFVVGWNIVWTSLILCFIKYALRIPLRMTEAELLVGSEVIHDEVPYVFGQGDAHNPVSAGNSPSKIEKGVLTIGHELPKEPGNGSGSGDNEVPEVKID